jgi:hypothetical protein
LLRQPLSIKKSSAGTAQLLYVEKKFKSGFCMVLKLIFLIAVADST